MDDLAAKDTPTAHDIGMYFARAFPTASAVERFFHKISSPACEVEPAGRKTLSSNRFLTLFGMRMESALPSGQRRIFKKMAALIPDEVGKVLLEVPQTDNQRAALRPPLNWLVHFPSRLPLNGPME